MFTPHMLKDADVRVYAGPYLTAASTSFKGFLIHSSAGTFSSVTNGKMYFGSGREAAVNDHSTDVESTNRAFVCIHHAGELCVTVRSQLECLLAMTLLFGSCSGSKAITHSNSGGKTEATVRTSASSAIELNGITRRAISDRPIARHVADTQCAPLFLELHCIL
jgi:hypothetical protein